MSEENQKVTDGASGDGEGKTTPPPATTVPKVEVKEGATFLDGKKVVLESDLIAAKKSLEGQMEQAQTVHSDAIDKAKLEVSEAQQQIATLNANIKENEEARKTGAVSDEEAARVKQELETTRSSLEQANSSALEHRRALIVMKYGVPEDTIKDKTSEQLDSFEEAAKAFVTVKGGAVGPYAVGGGSADAAPQTNIERATKILEATPIRGVSNAALADK
ncbi:hypothetical protein LCGC14_0591450 [marine sediment metagenome]|uniref:Uncharacterized protein n=1 Tax=marine sediment metagenome TaxID=412755 RepID=A0A0F9ULW3_9ZZZZ